MNSFIGYWSQRTHSDPPDYFKTLTAQASFNCALPGKSRAAVIGWGDNCIYNYLDERITVSLSAGGINDRYDTRAVLSNEGLALSRDPFGRVTLFWCQLGERVWFSTSLQLLLPLLEKRTVTLAALYGYSCFSYVPEPLTPIEGIAALPAGCQLDLPGPHSAKRYFDWQESAELISDESVAVTQLQTLLDEAINSQLERIGTDEVGVFLSGGLDSSITAALLKRAGVRVRAYALDFGAYGISELPYAEMVANSLRIPLVKVSAAPRKIARVVTATARALDLPYGDGVTAPLYLLNEAASNDVEIVFNGEGGDQLFAGWTNKPIIAAGVYQQLKPEAGDLIGEYLRTFHRLHGYEEWVFSAAALSEIKQMDAARWLFNALDGKNTPSLLHQLRRANLLLKGAQNIQPRATNLAYAHSLKVRTPFCYLPLARWTFQLAGDLFLRGCCEKYLLKRAVADLLPHEVVWREKRGMGVPLTSWLLGPLWRKAGGWLNPEILRAEGRWQPDLALRIATGKLSGHIQGRRIGESLWLLIMWQSWRQAVMHEALKEPFYNPFWLPHFWWQWRMQESFY